MSKDLVQHYKQKAAECRKTAANSSTHEHLEEQAFRWDVMAERLEAEMRVNQTESPPSMPRWA